MKLNMLSTKPGTIFGYVMSGGTGTAGAANIAKEQILEIDPHTIIGFTLSEVALVIGIIGVFTTMLFQYLNYRNIKKANKDA